MAKPERFSSTFLDLSPEELPHLSVSEDVQTNGAEGVVLQFGDDFVLSPTLDGAQAAPGTAGQEQPTNPFSADFTPTVEEGRPPTFETQDSMSSQEQDGSEQPSDPQGIIVVAEINEHHDPPGGGTIVTRTSDTWERFEAKGFNEPSELSSSTDVTKKTQPQATDKGATSATTSNGIVEPPKVQDKKKQWEVFEDSGPITSKLVQKRLSPARDDHGAVCAADAVVSDSQWTALDDTRQRIQVDFPDSDSPSLPFRKTQSMRATTNRKVQIVDALRRRLSNTSLDRYPLGQFDNEDELTRKFNVEREWQVYVKMDKKIRGTKTKWLPVNVSIRERVLVMKRSAPPSMPVSSSTVVPPDTPPLNEIHLHHNHTLTNPVARSYDRKSKLHQIKMQQTRVHERRTLRRWLFIEHVSSAHTIVKIGCPDLTIVESLSDQISEAIRQLPVTRQQGVAYRMNEIFIDVKDQSEILMNSDGAVLERKSLNRVYIQAFLTGAPECSLVLNDIEAILLQGKGQMSNSMSRQVKLNDVVLHPCVDQETYKSSRELKFQPVDGYPFELIRCAIDPYVSPPLNVSALMEFDEERNTVRITSSFIVRKKLNVRLRPIKDLLIKFPISSSWSSLFLADSRFGGKKSIRSTSALRGSFRRKVKSSACQIETQLGSAKYEPEHGAIIWRVGHYTRTELPHTFRCDVRLKTGMFALM